MISIIGLGWFGSALARDLLPAHQVLGTTRSPEKLKDLSDMGVQIFELNSNLLPAPELMKSSVIVINIPPFEGQLEWFKKWNLQTQSHLIFISSTSVYGEDQFVAEESLEPTPESVGGKILKDEEEWVRTFPQHTIIRFGGLLGSDRHPGKYLSGRSGINHGSWPVNLVHQDDCVGFIRLCIEKSITGTFNLVSDDHRSRQEFYTDYCRKKGLALPEFNADKSQGKIVSNQKAKSIYQFKHNKL